MKIEQPNQKVRTISDLKHGVLVDIPDNTMVKMLDAKVVIE